MSPVPHVPLSAIGGILSQEAQTPAVQAILSERGSRYGSFTDNARISQRLKRLFREENMNRNKTGRPPLSDIQMEALEMMAAKICRIFSGDPDYDDNWADIAGYAELVRKPR